MRTTRLAILAVAAVPAILGIWAWTAREWTTSDSPRKPRRTTRTPVVRDDAESPATPFTPPPQAHPDVSSETARSEPEHPKAKPSPPHAPPEVESDSVRLETWLLTQSTDNFHRLRESPDFDRHVGAVTEYRLDAGGPEEAVLAGVGRFLTDLNRRIEQEP